MADFRLEMSFQGIGPHANSVFDERMKSINMAIYANNGSGKSFISKSFKRVTDLYSLDICIAILSKYNKNKIALPIMIDRTFSQISLPAIL